MSEAKHLASSFVGGSNEYTCMVDRALLKSVTPVRVMFAPQLGVPDSYVA